MKKILRSSLLWRAITAGAAWLDGQWSKSYTSLIFQGSGNESSGGLLGKAGRGVHRALCAVFRALRLDKLLEGSITTQCYFWMCLAVLIAPILPTMAAIGAVLIASASLTVRFGMEPGRRLVPSPVTKWVGAFAVIYAVSTIFSVDFRGSLPGGAVTVLFTLFAVVVMNCIDSRERMERLWSIIVASGFVVALIGIGQAALGLQSTETWVDLENFEDLTLRVYSTLDNPNVLSEYLLLVTPLAAAGVYTSRTANGRIASLTAAGACLLCLVLTWSRGGWLGIAFAAALFLVIMDRRFIILGAVGLLALLPMLPAGIWARLSSIGDLSDSSTSYRVYIWLATLNLLRDYWLAGFGTGVEAFRSVYPRYSFNAIAAPHSHNLFLQMFCECGIFGLTALLGVFLSAVRALGGALRGRRGPERARCAAVIAALGGFAVQSMTDHSFYNYRVMLMFWVIVGLGAAMAGLYRREARN